MTKEEYLAKIALSLNGRYRNCSLGVFLVVSIVVFIMFLLEILKFAKKIYTHNIPQNQNKYLISKIIQHQEKVPQGQTEIYLNNRSQIDKSNARQSTASALPKIQKASLSTVHHPREETVEELGKSVKALKIVQKQPEQQERLVKFINRTMELIKQKLPLLSICIVNVAMVASFEFLIASLCIGFVLMIIIEVLRKSEYQNVAWILDLIVNGLVISWFINIFTVGMPI